MNASRKIVRLLCSVVASSFDIVLLLRSEGALFNAARTLIGFVKYSLANSDNGLYDDVALRNEIAVIQ